MTDPDVVKAAQKLENERMTAFVELMRISPLLTEHLIRPQYKCHWKMRCNEAWYQFTCLTAPTIWVFIIWRLFT